MKFLRIPILFAIIMGYATASTFRETELGEAIDNRDFATVKKLCEQNESLCEEGMDYVFDTKDNDFIADFIKFGSLVTGYAGFSLLKKSPEAAKMIASRIGVTEEDMESIGPRSNPAISPKKFVSLLNKMPTCKGQECAVILGVRWLFAAKRTDCIYPLLDAIEGKKFLNKFLNYTLFLVTFITATRFNEEVWAEHLHDYFMIGPDNYSIGLIYSGMRGVQDPIFKMLLATADRQDLRKLQAHKGYAQLSVESRAAIDEALPIAKPGGARLRLSFERVMVAKQTFEEFTSLGIPKVIADIIGSYAVLRPNLGERAETARRVINEIIGVSSATEIIGDIVAYFVGTDEDCETSVCKFDTE